MSEKYESYCMQNKTKFVISLKAFLFHCKSNDRLLVALGWHADYVNDFMTVDQLEYI